MGEDGVWEVLRLRDVLRLLKAVTHAAEEDWFVQYFVEGDRVFEASIFSPRHVECCVCPRFLNRVLSVDMLFSYVGHHHGDEILSVGVCVGGRKTLNICLQLSLFRSHVRLLQFAGR